MLRSTGVDWLQEVAVTLCLAGVQSAVCVQEAALVRVFVLIGLLGGEDYYGS